MRAGTRPANPARAADDPPLRMRPHPMTLTDHERRSIPSHLHDLAARARAELRRFETFPGTELRLEFGGGASAFAVASMATRDAEDRRRMVRTQKAKQFRLDALEQDVTERLGALAREALVSLLTHEVDEWLRLDGAPVRPPHDGRGYRIEVHLPDGEVLTIGHPSEATLAGGTSWQ